MNWKKIFSLVFVVIGTGLITLAIVYLLDDASGSFIHPLTKREAEVQEFPLRKYEFLELAKQPAQPSQIQIQELLGETEAHTEYMFSYETGDKTMTGQLNVPTEATPAAGFPVVLMLRGFVDPSLYTTGIGTRNAAAVFADNGYITIAPDFLGYGESDPPDPHVLAARFEKPKQVIDLIASLSTLDFVNPDELVMWAHSNGGQIGLSVLEITGKAIPTTLWAPVSKPFPYSILFYTDEYDDQGKALRKILAEFEQDYDVYDFSIATYWNRIQAPIQIHHGSADDAAPIEWSDELEEILKKYDVEVTLISYPGADHNLRPNWNEVVAADLRYFETNLDKGEN